jgi:hypothetical protein
LDGQSVIGHVFNSVVVDGQAGLLSMDGSSSFDEYTVMTNASQFAVAVSTHEEASSTDAIEPVEYLAPDAAELVGMMDASFQFWGNSGIVVAEKDSSVSTISESDEIEQVALDAYGASYALNSDADSHLYDAYLLGFDSWMQFPSAGVDAELHNDPSGTGYSYDPLFVSEFTYFTEESSLLTLVNSSLLETTRYILPDYSSDKSGYLFLKG